MLCIMFLFCFLGFFFKALLLEICTERARSFWWLLVTVIITPPISPTLFSLSEFSNYEMWSVNVVSISVIFMDSWNRIVDSSIYGNFCFALFYYRSWNVSRKHSFFLPNWGAVIVFSVWDFVLLDILSVCEYKTMGHNDFVLVSTLLPQ